MKDEKLFRFTYRLVERLSFIVLVLLFVLVLLSGVFMTAEAFEIGKKYKKMVPSLPATKETSPYLSLPEAIDDVRKKQMVGEVQKDLPKDLTDDIINAALETENAETEALEVFFNAPEETEENVEVSSDLNLENQYVDPPVEEYVIEEPQAEIYEMPLTEHLIPIEDFLFMGIVHWGGFKYSYYSEKILPGGGLNIPGRHNSGGFVRNGDGLIVLASNFYEKGTILPTPFGSDGIVLDYCPECASNQLDCYVE